MDTAPARITVRRDAPDDVGHRQIIMSVDGEPLAILTYKQSVTREFAPGRHTLKAYNTLVTKTIDFDLAAGGHAEFVVANVSSGWMFSALAVLGVGPIGLRLERA